MGTGKAPGEEPEVKVIIRLPRELVYWAKLAALEETMATGVRKTMRAIFIEALQVLRAQRRERR